MAVPASLPAPRTNMTSTGLRRASSGIVAADVIVAVGDYTAGAAEDMFTLTAHGLVDGDIVHCLWQSAYGAVTGGEGTRAVVNQLTADTFQLTTDGTTVIENTADGTAVFLKGRTSTAVVDQSILPYIIVGTGALATDIFTPAQGTKGLQENDTLKLLYESAAGVVVGALDVTYYAVTVTATSFKLALTSGGAAVDQTADGTAVFLKTS